MSDEIAAGLFLGSIVVVTGSLYAQRAHYIFLERQKTIDKTIHESGEIDKLRKEFTEYKKRVDALTLKAGFKL